MKAENKVAIVTGGGGALGLGIASKLLEQGAKTIILDIDKSRLDAIDEKFEKYQIDLTDYNAVQNVINVIISVHGTIDILVNNAGIIYSEPLINIMHPNNMKHSYDQFKSNLEINLNSVFIMSSIVCEQMVLTRTRGVIINISSISAQGNAGQTVYSAAKAGVEAMTKTWAKELGVFGIRAVAIAPGFIDTVSTSEALNGKILEHIVKNTPLRKLGEIKNVVQSVCHIIENDFLTGTVLDVNGGLTI